MARTCRGCSSVVSAWSSQASIKTDAGTKTKIGTGTETTTKTDAGSKTETATDRRPAPQQVAQTQRLGKRHWWCSAPLVVLCSPVGCSAPLMVLSSPGLVLSSPGRVLSFPGRVLSSRCGAQLPRWCSAPPALSVVLSRFILCPDLQCLLCRW
jgi:hypothetical protein